MVTKYYFGYQFIYSFEIYKTIIKDEKRNLTFFKWQKKTKMTDVYRKGRSFLKLFIIKQKATSIWHRAVCKYLLNLIKEYSIQFWYLFQGQNTKSTVCLGRNSTIVQYGNKGCGVFKRGVQNQKGFCLRIDILKD